MTSTSISTDLQSLLPTLVGPVPSELVNLATSLLAQSRSRISNLKSTEEVARSYVCAHLACERLKNSLDLPPLNPRPPLPKKAYDALISHFRKSLPATTRARKKVELVESDAIEANDEDEVVDLCNELGVVPISAEYIISGLKMTEHRPAERYSLIIALALIVFENLSVVGNAASIRGMKWIRNDNSGQKAVRKMEMINAALGNKARIADVSAWLRKWKKGVPEEHLAWIRTIPDGVGLVPERAKRDNAWRRDCMLQDRVDYLSEGRKEAFGRWSADVLRRCGEIDGVSG